MTALVLELDYPAEPEPVGMFRHAGIGAGRQLDDRLERAIAETIGLGEWANAFAWSILVPDGLPAARVIAHDRRRRARA